MKISKIWMSEFISNLKIHNLEHELTQLGLEVDTVKKQKGDYIIDIEFTPNRGDCLSIYGTSRDLAAFKNKKIKIPSESKYRIQKHNKFINKISSDICPEYRYMILKNINSKKNTPKYIKDRLIKSDISPVNIIVDISNYVMMEIGQPTHAFDLDKLNGQLSIIKNKKNQTFLGLNDKEYKIEKGIPVIADDLGVIHALPGVIGSKISSVTANTTNILFESAFFLPDVVRSISSKYRIQTDSSYRFERGVDFNSQEFALSRIHNILSSILDIEKCMLTKISQKHTVTKVKSFKFDHKLFGRILGIELGQTKIKNILRNLGFVFKSDIIIIPSHRFDISTNYDLVEEVSRMIGYDNIPETPLLASVNTESKKNYFNDRLVTLGYKEAINFTFIQKNYSRHKSNLELQNPISKDKSVMRESLIPGLLKNIQYNFNRQNKSIMLFEAGKVYTKPSTKIIESNTISGVLYGLRSPYDLVKNQYLAGIGDLKADILSLLPGSTFDKNNDSIYFDEKNSLKVLFNKKNIGECGLIKSGCANDFDIKSPVYAFELNLDDMHDLKQTSFSNISQYPAVYKDITLITNIDDNLSKIIKSIRKNNYKYMKSIRIKDIFIDKDKLQLENRNVTLEICLQSDMKTLNDDEINTDIQSLIADIKERYKLKIQEL